METRYDRVELKATRTNTGAIVDTPVLTRTGVFEYRNADGTTRKEYRPPEVVFNADSLKAFKGLAITNGHHGKINSKNVQSSLLGTVVSEGRNDGSGNLIADVVIHATSPIDGEGNKELSVGYDVEIDETPGTTPEGERYDVKQTKVSPNHLGVVKKGRAGNARLNLDSSEDESDPETEVKKGAAMPKIRLDNGIEYDAAPEVIHAVEKMRSDSAKLEAERDAAKADADKAKAEADAAKADVTKIRQDAVAQAKARIELEGKAKALAVDFKADATDRQLREGIIAKTRNDGVDLAGKSDAYIEAAYDLAVAQSAAQGTAAAAQREAVHGNAGGNQQQQRGDAKDNAPESAAAARNAFIAAQRGN